MLRNPKLNPKTRKVISDIKKNFQSREEAKVLEQQKLEEKKQKDNESARKTLIKRS